MQGIRGYVQADAERLEEEVGESGRTEEEGEELGAGEAQRGGGALLEGGRAGAGGRGALLLRSVGAAARSIGGQDYEGLNDKAWLPVGARGRPRDDSAGGRRCGTGSACCDDVRADGRCRSGDAGDCNGGARRCAGGAISGQHGGDVDTGASAVGGGVDQSGYESAADGHKFRDDSS